MDVDELITVVPYNPQWSQLFSHEQQHLQEVLGNTVVDIQHVGSTAVPGLAAKPIVDILVGLRKLSLATEYLAVLETLGYEYLGEAGVPERLYFRKRHAHLFNLHLVQWGSEIWINNLLLRDFLRAHPQEANRYGQHKQELIKSGIVTLLAYSDRKAAVIADLLERARAWRA